MDSIAENVRRVRERMAAAALSAGRKPEEIRLVAASKMNDAQRVRAAIAAGVDICGENRVQELLEKKKLNAYTGCAVHMIGHLQKNKVRQVVGAVDMIESADSLELLTLIDRQAEKLAIVQPVLVEVNIGGEASKSGVAPEELPALLEQAAALSHLQIRGLMTIPPVEEKTGGNRAYFARMQQLFVDIRSKKYDNVLMAELSMGMSGDFEDAVREGATLVRVGSAIFGPRHY